MVCCACGLPPPEAGQGTYSVEELQLLIVQSHQAGILEDIERRVMQRGTQVENYAWAIS